MKISNRITSVFQLGLLLLSSMASLEAQSAQNNYLMWQFPNNVSYPIYVYSGNAQVGYIYGATQQAFFGVYDPASTTANRTLYYQSGTTWYGCTLAIQNGSVSASSSTCPGAVINPPVNQNGAQSNVYTVAFGASAWPTSSSGPSPTPTAPNYAAHRRWHFSNKTSYYAIRIGMVCTQSVNPDANNCNTEENLFEVYQGQPMTFVIDDPVTTGTMPGLTSYGFHVSAFKKTQNGKWHSTGGYGVGQQPYASKLEATTLAIPLDSNGNPIPKGPTNVDLSLVDGYNFNIRLSPTAPVICTYTVPPENSNVLGAGTYGPGSPLAQLNLGSLKSNCSQSSQFPPGAQGANAWNLSVKSKTGAFAGCMSPCSYATKTFGASSSAANTFCCTGAYATPSSCGVGSPPTTQAAPNSTYVTNLVPPVSQNAYRFAYDDAIGDFSCPAETSFKAEVYNGQIPN